MARKNAKYPTPAVRRRLDHLRLTSMLLRRAQDAGQVLPDLVGDHSSKNRFFSHLVRLGRSVSIRPKWKPSLSGSSVAETSSYSLYVTLTGSFSAASW